MPLKKVDKIIAVIGVIILIIAGIGIYLYTAQEETKKVVPPPEINSYEIIVNEVNQSVEPDNTDYSIKAGLFRSGTYDGTLQISGYNIKSVEFYVSFADNKVGIINLLGLLKSIGADSFTFLVMDDQENEIDSIYIKGFGNGTIPINIGTKIPDEIIEAKDPAEARAILEEKYVKSDLTYYLSAQLKTALWGKIRELLGSDYFTLQISYTYYTYDILEIGNPVESGGNDGGDGGTDYSWMTYTGFH